MDPNKVLERIRELIEEIDNGYSVDMNEFATLVDSLDKWLSRGGFLPEGWAHA